MAPRRRPRVVNGRLSKPREPGRLGDLAKMTVLGLVLALPAFLYAGLQAQLHEYRREVVAFETQIRELDDEHRRLDVELAMWSDPRRIGELAHDVSGLMPAGQEQVVYLPRSPEPPARDPNYIAAATGDDDGRQRP